MASEQECLPLPVFRHKESPEISKDCSKDEAARKLYSDAAPATSLVSVGLASGSGFFVGDGSQVVTNAHVVNGMRDLISITAHDGQRYKARIENIDDINDLAVLRLEDNKRSAAALKIADSINLKKGDELFMLGHPEGRAATYISPGTFESRYPLKEIGKGLAPPAEKTSMAEQLERAAKAYGDASKRDFEKYATSERIEMYLHGLPGSSGSAVLNKNGELVSVLANGAAVKALEEHSWSVPSERLQALLQPENQKFNFKYETVSLFYSSPILRSSFTVGTGALALGLPRLGGTLVGGIGLLALPGDFASFQNAKTSNDKLFYGLNTASDISFAAGALLSYIPRARAAAVIAKGIGLTGLASSLFVPHVPYLTEITRKDGEARPPFLWRG